jgi:hypothetical protein
MTRRIRNKNRRSVIPEGIFLLYVYNMQSIILNESSTVNVPQNVALGHILIQTNVPRLTKTRWAIVVNTPHKRRTCGHSSQIVPKVKLGILRKYSYGIS